MTRRSLALLLIGLPLASCDAAPAVVTPTPATGRPAPPLTGGLTVFAAASLTEAFTEMGTAFEVANAGTKVTYNFAGSPALRTQLREGARADLLATADEPIMQGAQQDGTIADDPRIFAHNKLVVVVAQPKANDITRLQDLAKPGVKLVVAQAAVPVGAYARQALTRMSADPAFGADVVQRVQANIVSQEANVRQIVSKVRLGEADAGIVYASDVTPAVRPQVTVLAVPDQFNVIARYPIATVTGVANPAVAQAFIEYVLAPAGQVTLQRWGFIPAGPTSAAAGRRAPA